MPGATAESVLQAVASSCRQQYGLQQHAVIDDDAVVAFAASLDLVAIREASSAVRMPLAFDNLAAEVNFYSLLALLDFGSGYNDELQRGNQRDARELSQFGLLGIYLQQSKIDAKLLSEFSHYHVAEFWRLETHVDEQLQPGITVARPGPLAAYSALLRSALVQTGALLASQGCPDLGTFVLRAIDDASAAGSGGGGREGSAPGEGEASPAAAAGTAGGPSAAALVQRLSEALPAFSDAAEVDGRRVLFLRKAQQLALDLHQRFAAEHPARFAFADAAELAGDSSPATLAVLRASGLLKLGPEAVAAIDGGADVPTGSGLEVCLRAACLEACARLAAAVGKGSDDGAQVSAAHIGAYLRRLADADARYKGEPRLRNRSTLAY